MSPRLLSVSILALALLGAAPASAYIASNGLQVNAAGGQSFAAIYRSGATDTDYWCAAGDYARAKLGATGSTDIYRVSPPPRRGGQGISFSLSSEGAASSTGLTVFGTNGASISASLAKTFCRQLGNKQRN